MMKKKLLTLFCLICFAWSVEGCAAFETVKKYIGRIEVCVKGVCIRVDKDGDGKLETHFTKDEEENPHDEPEPEDSGGR